ncbi:hypothetical protein FHW79_006315 [Azospirillum sp. OGB3]|uniref:hypothetical protein n=1 Tax=Azospirillum sp. OGB3 TaxID=2587012 RepID=UPI001605CB48|nr:hypothetical protein [Azospirillum sp. OGB3]MBB3268640.1 hypothetical protein [Azospirillum sp. OGB3]
MADFILFPLRVIDSVIGLFGQFGVVGTAHRIRNRSVKFNRQGMAFYRADLDTIKAPQAQK